MAGDSALMELLRGCLDISLGNEDLTATFLEIEDSSKTQGFVCEIVFLRVDGMKDGEIKKVFYLAVKYVRNDRIHLHNIRKSVLVESFIYSNIFPELTRLSMEKGIGDDLMFIPWVYACLDSDFENAIVMENLSKSEYKPLDKKQHMNMSHLKIVLEKYGKLHAASFAYKDQYPETFEEMGILLVCNDVMKTFKYSPEIKVSLENNLDEVLTMLKENGDDYLHDNLQNTFPKSPVDILDDIRSVGDSQVAICHGDSCNNNFLFKYMDFDETEPISVKIIDWQLAGLRSPVFDLSHFIYASASPEEIKRFDELLVHYYHHFSTFLSKLGSNPQDLFTFADLRRHWKKYGISGVVASINSLKIQLSDETPGDSEYGSGKYTVFELPLSVRRLYYLRCKAVITHYFSMVHQI